MGIPLEVVLRQREPALSRSCRVALLIQWAEALVNILHHIHDRGVVHGDVKPDNLILTGEGDDLCIIDFGIAVLSADGIPRIGLTDAYATDSMLEGGAVSAESDFVALAYTVHALDTGVAAWEEFGYERDLNTRPSISSLPTSGAAFQFMQANPLVYSGFFRAGSIPPHRADVEQKPRIIRFEDKALSHDAAGWRPSKFRRAYLENDSRTLWVWVDVASSVGRKSCGRKHANKPHIVPPKEIVRALSHNLVTTEGCLRALKFYQTKDAQAAHAKAADFATWFESLPESRIDPTLATKHTTPV